jgi:nitric oxide reductase subunit C
MNKRQTRLFAIGCSALASVAFIAMTIDTHAQIAELTNAENLTPEVKHGSDVWHKCNCINCHTLFGEGAYYAPDLTKITKLRGESYLKAYMRDPSKFYDEQKHRRLMPKQDLSETEIHDLILFLTWVSNVDNQGWPPRPILVTGASLPGTSFSTGQQGGREASAAEGAKSALPPGARPTTKEDDPIALGENLLRTAVPACVACHSIAPGVNLAGPSLAGVSARTRQLLTSEAYTGSAKDVAGYIRESILTPSAHRVPGAMYSADGTSFMPNTYAETLTSQEVDYLVAYLQSIK